jgi:hypothetical protein
MVLLDSDKIKIKILEVLNNSNTELSMNLLRKKVDLVNYNSLQRNCEFLALINFIKIEKKTVENRNYNFITITEEGKNI